LAEIRKKRRQEEFVHRIFAMLCLLAAALAPQAASAVTTITTYVGKVATGTDLTGVFGPLGDMTGRAFTLSFTYDFSTPGADVSSSPTYSYAQGFSSGASTLGPITLKIGDVAKTIANPDFTLQTIGDWGVSGLFTSFTKTISQGPFPVQSYFADAYVAGFATDFLPSAVFGTAFTYTLAADDIMQGNFGFDNDPTYSLVGVSELAFGTFAIESVSVAAIPEPEGWAMMIAGLVFIGAMLRSRRSIDAPILRHARVSFARA
jgi:hypothetical protein